ncbi:MAG: hypothetical protein Kow0047_22760 [Anaerolineae bacterium]
MVEPGGHLTSGLILTYQNLFLFGIEPRDQWRRQDGRWRVHYIGIGGHRDPGETWMETVSREAMEEAGCAVRLLDGVSPCWCERDGTLRPLSLTWDEPIRPLFLWEDRFDLPRHGRRQVHFVGLAFRAEALSEPRPGAEIPAIIGLSAAQTAETLAGGLSLGELLDQGAALWEAVSVPRNAILSPAGTARFFAAYLRAGGQPGSPPSS